MTDSAGVRRPARTYDQYCAVARGLDIIGERWTLLIIRDLLTGPKRYKDLLLGLPGIGTNLLAARLRELESHALVQKSVLPPPAGSAVYELTEAGLALEPALLALGRWGSRFLGPPRANDHVFANAYFVAMRAAFQAQAAAELQETYEFRIDGQVFEVRVDHGRLVTRQGRPSAPDAVFTTDARTLGALLHQDVTATEALASGRVRSDDRSGALERFTALFVLPSRAGGVDPPAQA